MTSWSSFEEKVRDLARHIWGAPCTPQRIGGVNIDGVIKLDAEFHIYIEITEERSLNKVRTDVIKLTTAKHAALAQGVLAKSFCVVNGPVTNGMKESGKANNIQVLSSHEFSRLFFDFERYRVAREDSPFGSSIDPLTGESDDTEYVRVRYVRDDSKQEADLDQIATWLKEGKRLILLGEYGSGKSRCIREIFRHLSDTAVSDCCFPVAINLRQSWGLSRSTELLRRHFSDLGLADVEQSAIRAFRSGSVAMLLDGFDEVGSQAWSNDGQKLKVIRAKSLEGVKETIIASKGGVLITGREHYFPNPSEMYQALGLIPSKTIVLRCNSEFNDSELLEYFEKRDLEVDIPSWLPRRPLICQTISTLDHSKIDSMFGGDGDEVDFWNHFIRVLCERDARIHVSFDPETIYSIFVYLARLTRGKAANVGPITLAELQSAFESATGAAPIEEASLMLQRLPTLGRVSAETNDRQFVDVYILDGLRAKDIVRLGNGTEAELGSLEAASWQNPLSDLGQRVLAGDKSLSLKHRISLARRFANSRNKVLASDLISSALRSATPDVVDFEGISLSNGDFLYLPLFERSIRNISLVDCYIGELALPALTTRNVKILKCIAQKVTGVSSAAVLPEWIVKLDAEHFDSVESISRIRRIGLDPSHEILITIIRKTFFQKGSGRKEEALLRGLGMVGTKNLSRRILNLMIADGLLTSFPGKEGEVYSPVRSHTRRMQRILDELKASSDTLWIAVGNL